MNPDPDPLLVDTHAHICDARFDPDRAAMLDRALAAGVSAVVAVGEDIDDARKNLELATTYPMLRPAAGLYPGQPTPAEAEEMITFIRTHRRRLWAIGEVGIDFWLAKTEEDRRHQEEIFCQFIHLAAELNLPLNVHSRSAGRRAVELLMQNSAKRVQLHAFDGKYATAAPAVEAGYFFSIPPSVVRSRQKQKLVGHLPLRSLLVETDSPVLGADPAARNEPARLMTSVEAIAEIKKVPAAVVMDAIAANVRILYGQKI
ncbi:MAG: TatD family hydrolase [Desulfobacterales bacterium]|nr:TatD family hydrolase [Desulfobacterales bacterium]